jgi:hypothetical protein
MEKFTYRHEIPLFGNVGYYPRLPVGEAGIHEVPEREVAGGDPKRSIHSKDTLSTYPIF